MDPLTSIIALAGPLFAVLNAALIPVHWFLIRRAYRIADGVKVDHSLPLVTEMMRAQRGADRNAINTTIMSGLVMIFITMVTIMNAIRYLG